MYEVDFEAPPALGHTQSRYGNTYVCVGVEPYNRKTDGAAAWLLTWASECADCGAPFVCRSGLRTKSLNRRCDAHKRPMRAASKEAKDARRNAAKRNGAKARAAAKAKRKRAKELAALLA